MGRALPFAIINILPGWSRTRRLAGIIASILILVAAILSQSAGALLLGIPASILMLLLLWNYRYAAAGFIVAAAGGAAALPALLRTPRFSRLLDLSSGTNFFRLRVWQSAWNMIQDRPVQGYGLDQFLYQYRGRYILPDAWQEPNLSHPHNILLDFWIRLGVGGVLLLFWMLLVFARSVWGLYRRIDRQNILWLMTLATTASMTDLIVHGLVDNSVFVLDLSFVFVLIIAMPSLIERAAGSVPTLSGQED
jgi:O-antigen ligase